MDDDHIGIVILGDVVKAVPFVQEQKFSVLCCLSSLTFRGEWCAVQDVISEPNFFP